MIEPDVSDNGLVAEFSSINMNNFYFCTELIINKSIKKLYFMNTGESGGGGSYHDINSIYAAETMEEIIDIALDTFNEEHNRDDECPDCTNDICKKKFIGELKKNYSSSFICTDYEDMPFDIWTMEL